MLKSEKQNNLTKIFSIYRCETAINCIKIVNKQKSRMVGVDKNFIER